MAKKQPTISLIGTKVVYKQSTSMTFCVMTIGNTYEVIAQSLDLGIIRILDDVNILRWLPMQDFYLAAKDGSSFSAESGVGDKVLCTSSWVGLTVGKNYTILKQDIPYAKISILADNDSEGWYPELLFNMTKPAPWTPSGGVISKDYSTEWEEDDDYDGNDLRQYRYTPKID